MAIRVLRLLLAVCLAFSTVGSAEAGKVKNAIFRAFGYEEEKGDRADGDAQMDEDLRELVDWLKAHGYEEFATPEWVDKFDDEGLDSVEDFCHIVSDEEYEDLGIEKAKALEMQKDARKYMLEAFLLSVPVPEGKPSDIFLNFLQPLIAAGYDEPEDVADLDEEEGAEIGIDKALLKILVLRAEEYDTRDLLRTLLTSFGEESGSGGAVNPFADEHVWRPLVDAIMKAGVRSLADLMELQPSEGISKEHLALIKSDERVRRYAGKQEL
jgi:hypothetical protein